MQQASSKNCPFLPKNESYASLTRQKGAGSIMKGKSPRKNLKVQILDGMLEEKSEDDGTPKYYNKNDKNKDLLEEPGKIQKQFAFYMSQSNLSRRSQVGAERNNR